MKRQFHSASQHLHLPNIWDAVAFVLIIALVTLFSWAAQQMSTPYEVGESLCISLSPWQLPHYGLRTVLRMAIALLFSLLFSVLFGTLAAKYRRAESLILPAIDILQSVPILGFLSITVVLFIKLFPGSLLGPECAAIFVIFTSQAWNMALSFYQSLKTVPTDLKEAARMYHLSAWQTYWRIEVPFAIPSLLWNTMISLSGGWFFVVATEAISVAEQQIMLPGIGSYIAVAIQQESTQSLCYAIMTMFFIILAYDQLLFRPLIKWSEKFKSSDSEDDEESHSWVFTLLKRTRWLQRQGEKLAILMAWCVNVPSKILKRRQQPLRHSRQTSPYSEWLWRLTLTLLLCAGFYYSASFILSHLSLDEILHVFGLGLITASRVLVMIFLCSLLWIPVGVWIGLRANVASYVQPIAQFLAAFPANLLYPLVVLFIVRYALNVEIWTTPLMVLGTQWYILFNVIAGASAIPKDLRLAAKNLGLRGTLWWQRFMLPAIFPYYITGALAAAGGAWNASILSEVVEWGNTTLVATGLGSYITQHTQQGDFPRIALGIGIMCLYVLLLNRFFWQKLYNYAARRFHVE